MEGAILTLNAGSSSLKLGLFAIAAEGDVAATVRGEIEGIGDAPHFIARDRTGKVLAERRWPGGKDQTHEVFLDDVLEFAEAQAGELSGAGHRVVHGGAAHAAPALVTPALLADLEALVPLAPLHQPHNLAPMRAIARLRPGLPQVACFDTAFHHAMPALATRIALPRALQEAGIRRYGFHGLSYEFIARRLAELAPALARGRVIAAHLGSGASLCALRDGRSMDTTMGFTALDGLMMATRCGSIDPGVILYLQQQRGLDARAVEDLLYHRSGLLGVSGISSDMRALTASADPRAADAIDLFVWRIARECGALLAALGGLDGLVFTAGIGEHTPAVRAAVCDRLAWLGVRLDPDANANGAGRISAADSAVEVWVIPTDEETTIARHTLEVVGRHDGEAG